MSRLHKEDIDALIVITSQRANKIKHVDSLLSQMPESRSKRIYMRDMLKMIAEYKTQVSILEIVVNDYLEQTRKTSGETNLVYYKLAKALKET